MKLLNNAQFRALSPEAQSDYRMGLALRDIWLKRKTGKPIAPTIAGLCSDRKQVLSARGCQWAMIEWSSQAGFPDEFTDAEIKQALA